MPKGMESFKEVSVTQEVISEEIRDIDPSKSIAENQNFLKKIENIFYESNQPESFIEMDNADVRKEIPQNEQELNKLRMEHANGRGTWDGEVGNSKFMPESSEARSRLHEYGLNGIEYHNGVVDFSPIAEAQTTIEPMTSDLVKNKQLGYESLSRQFNDEAKEGRVDWTPREVHRWASERGLVFHECSDGKTVQLVDSKIHEACRHAGGRFEVAMRDMMSAHNSELNASSMQFLQFLRDTVMA